MCLSFYLTDQLVQLCYFSDEDIEAQADLGGESSPKLTLGLVPYPRPLQS